MPSLYDFYRKFKFRQAYLRRKYKNNQNKINLYNKQKRERERVQKARFDRKYKYYKNSFSYTLAHKLNNKKKKSNKKRKSTFNLMKRKRLMYKYRRRLISTSNLLKNLYHKKKKRKFKLKKLLFLRNFKLMVQNKFKKKKNLNNKYRFNRLVMFSFLRSFKLFFHIGHKYKYKLKDNYYRFFTFMRSFSRFRLYFKTKLHIKKNKNYMSSFFFRRLPPFFFFSFRILRSVRSQSKRFYRKPSFSYMDRFRSFIIRRGKPSVMFNSFFVMQMINRRYPFKFRCRDDYMYLGRQINRHWKQHLSWRKHFFLTNFNRYRARLSFFLGRSSFSLINYSGVNVNVNNLFSVRDALYGRNHRRYDSQKALKKSFFLFSSFDKRKLIFSYFYRSLMSQTNMYSVYGNNMLIFSIKFDNLHTKLDVHGSYFLKSILLKPISFLFK